MSFHLSPRFTKALKQIKLNNVKYLTSFSISENLKQSAYYGFGILLMKGVSLFMLPVFTAYLSIIEYGRLEILLALSSIGTILLGFGLVEALYRFSGLENTPSTSQQVAAQIFTLSLCVAGMALILTQIIAPYIADHLPGQIKLFDARLLLVGLALEACIAIPLAWLRMREKARLFFFFMTGKALGQSILTWILLYIGWGITGVLLASAIAASTLAILLCLSTYKDVGINFSWPRSKQYFEYGLPIVVSGIAGFGLAGFDRWLIADVISEAALAPYAIATKFVMVTLILMQPFSLWWYPRRFRLLNQTKGIELNAKYAVLGAAFGVLASGLIGITSPWLIRWLTPIEYHSAVQYIPLLSVAMALKIVSDLLNLGCFSEKDNRIQMQINLFCTAIGVFGFLVFINSYGVMAIVISLVIVNALRVILFYHFSQQKLFLPYRLLPLYSATTISIALISIGQMSF